MGFSARLAGVLFLVAATLPAFTMAQWHQLTALPQGEGNLAMTVAWHPDNGIRFAVSSADAADDQLQIDLSAAALRLQNSQQTSLYLDWRRHPSFAAVQQATLLLKMRRHRWSIYMDNVLIAHFAAPFAAPGQLLWPATELALLRAKPRFQPVAPENLQSDFMIEPDAPNQLNPWEIQRGEWTIHTVLEDAVEQAGRNVGRVNQVPPIPEQSPNFYCVKGKGTDAMLTAGYEFYDDYQYAASLFLAQNATMGLAFYHRDQDNYYAMTLQEEAQHGPYSGLITLWRNQDGVRTELARISTDLFAGQWYRPEVRIRDNRIDCYLDRVHLATVQEELPPGGRVGLYANGAAAARFDDIALAGLEDLRLETVRDIRLHTVAHDGSFFVEKSFWKSATPDNQPFLQPTAQQRPQRLVVGAPDDAAVVFGATFTVPDAETLDAGLIVGYLDAKQPHLEFHCTLDAGIQTFTLRSHDGDTVAELQNWSRRNPGATAIRLLADASEPGRLRLYCNDILVLVHHLDGRLHGAAGVLVSRNSTPRISQLTYAFERPELYRETAQTNAAYRTDPFMRHWAAPEGLWLGLDGTADGDLWYKGDLFGRFQVQVPAVPNAQLHIGTQETAADSGLFLRVHDNRISLYAGTDQQYANALATAELPATSIPAGQNAAEVAAAPPLLITCFSEDYWVWVEHAGKLLLRFRLEQPLAGSRMFVRGITQEQMSASEVVRFNVKSDFFTAAPSDWLINGGKWQIINRFQCRPSWSHMIGQSEDGLAAFWHKFQYGGDFCLEYYVGVRHGWYEGATDMNCTALAATTAVDTGYSVACSQWDPNLSQKYSTLYKQGQPVNRSDAYTLPRVRGGKQRHYLNPLVRGGRDMHGAWYYCKLRRIGNRVQYYFDNELVLQYDDPNTLASGLMGIWTFCNSMTVANVKMAAETIQPRAFAFTTELAPPPPVDRPDPATATAALPVITNHNMPILACLKQYWHSDDTVGQVRLAQFPGQANALILRNRLGAGAMAARASLPLLRYQDLAGFRVRLQRTATAAFNLHYRIGTRAAEDPAAEHPKPVLAADAPTYFHHISGTDFDLGTFQRVSQLTLPPVPELGPDAWETLTFWLPDQPRQAAAADPELWVEFTALGNLQRSPVLAGLAGAQPGAAYALADLCPIFYQNPQLALMEGELDADLILLEPETGSELFRSRDCQQLNEFLAKHTAVGMNHIRLRIGTTAAVELYWIKLPESPEIALAWDAEQPDTLLASTPHAWPEPRLATLTAQLDGQTLPFSSDPDGKHRLRLPRQLMANHGDQDNLNLTLAAGSWQHRATVPWRQRPRPQQPVLVALEQWPGFFAAFNQDALPEAVQVDAARHRLAHNAHASFLRTRNRGNKQRLRSDFSCSTALARLPVLQFRYATDDMGQISANLATRSVIHLSEPTNRQAIAVRHAPETLVLDHTWHTWTGMVADAITPTPFNREALSANSLSFRSHANPDQTGLHSFLHLDDIVFGPALPSTAVLKFTPHYLGFAPGALGVEFALSEGPAMYDQLTDQARAALTWQPAAADSALQPDLAQLDNGLHQLFVRARDSRQLMSDVTSLPLLIDNLPPVFAAKVVRSKQIQHNGQVLKVTADLHGGAPWQLDETVFTVDAKPVPLHPWGSTYTHTIDQDCLEYNHVLLLRHWLDKASDGETVTLQLDNLLDGAGNPAAAVQVPLKVNYATDKQPPSWFTGNFGKWVHLAWHGEGTQATGSTPFAPKNRNSSVIKTDVNGHYLHTGAQKTTGELVVNARKWQPARHPWLALRLRLPNWHSNAKSEFQIMLATNHGNLFLEFRGNQGDAKRNLLGEPPVLNPDAWQAFRFNIPELLEARGLTGPKFENLRVDDIHFRRRHTKHQEPLLIDDMMIYGQTPDAPTSATFSWDAFDASGVKALAVEAIAPDATTVAWEQTITDRKMQLTSLPLTDGQPAWLRCRVLDAAGNRSVPICIALP